MSTKIYRDQEREQGKEARKEEILQVAKELFLTEGFSKANMADIAEKSKISRKTLYRYFSSKEELAMEIELEVFRTLCQLQEGYLPTLSGNGYEKLSQHLQKMDELVEANKELIRFTGMFDYYLVDEYPSLTSQKAFIELIEKVDQPFINMISEGIEDGSIRINSEVAYVARTLSNSFLALAQRIVARQAHLNIEQHIESRRILTVQVELFLKALKA